MITGPSSQMPISSAYSSNPVAKQEESKFFSLVAEYNQALANQNRKEARSVSDRLVNEYRFDPDKGTFEGKPLPLTGKKMAIVAFQMFAVAKAASPSVNTGMNIPAMLLSGVVGLLKRLVETSRGLLNSSDSERKMEPVVERAKESLALATKLLSEIETRVSPRFVETLKENFSALEEGLAKLTRKGEEPLPLLIAMEDHVQQLVETSAVALRALFVRKPRPEMPTSYLADRQTAQADLLGAGEIMRRYPTKTKALKEQLAALTKALKELPQEGAISVTNSFEALDLRVKALALLAAVVKQVGNTENLFEGLRI